MKLILIISLLFCTAVQDKTQKRIEFPDGCPECIYDPSYRAHKRDIQSTILRPLKEFKIGTKYCLWGTKDWDDKCQDAAMEYAFGQNIKRQH